MSEIKCMTEVGDFAKEALSSARKSIFEIQGAALAVNNGADGAENIKRRCFEVRDRVRIMVGEAKEKLISLENLLLSQSEDSARWQRSKDSLTEFVKVAENNLDVLDRSCLYIEKAMEEIAEWKGEFVKCAEQFAAESEYGVKRLMDVAEIVLKYGALGRIGEEL